jgi:hypothetical protein
MAQFTNTQEEILISASLEFCSLNDIEEFCSGVYLKLLNLEYCKR